MKKIDIPLTVQGKGQKNTQSKKGKMFGYQVLGFGAGGLPKSDPVDVDYLVVAGGAAGGFVGVNGGGGGAGGHRTSFPGGTKITIDSGAIPITVGAGGPGASPPEVGAPGNNSVFKTITSSGGGGGAAGPQPSGDPGGSGGGGQTGPSPGGSGNAGGFSPPEGNNGGPGSPPSGSGQSSGGGGYSR